MKPIEPTIELHGPAATHNMRCAVRAGKSAVLDMTRGVFMPSWEAQADGWHLVQARTWLQKVALWVLTLNGLAKRQP